MRASNHHYNIFGKLINQSVSKQFINPGGFAPLAALYKEAAHSKKSFTLSLQLD